MSPYGAHAPYNRFRMLAFHVYPRRGRYGHLHHLLLDHIAVEFEGYSTLREVLVERVNDVVALVNLEKNVRRVRNLGLEVVEPGLKARRKPGARESSAKIK